MGFRSSTSAPTAIEPSERGAAEVWLHDMMLERADGAAFDLEALKARLEAAFMAVMRGRAENDGYNALVLTAGLPWRDVALLRTISRYLRQVRVAYSQDYMWATLRKHAGDRGADRRAVPRRASIRASTLSTEARAERAERDRRARSKTALQRGRRASTRTASCAASSTRCTSALRTNFYQIDDDGQPKPTIAIKFDSRKIDGLPLPQPLYEIFVYSPRVEGVHLRFGKVARGGIRWSDRPQDFRTEVLGLVKAQQVKNAVIVPVGAKGGFVPKQLPSAGPREAIQAEGIAAYKLFISSAARHHRQSRARRRHPAARTSCATTATIPISWSPPTRAPRRSPTSPTASRSSTASGSATPSRPAARPATTTRRWASRRAAPGKR